MWKFFLNDRKTLMPRIIILLIGLIIVGFGFYRKCAYDGWLGLTISLFAFIPDWNLFGKKKEGEANDQAKKK